MRALPVSGAVVLTGVLLSLATIAHAKDLFVVVVLVGVVAVTVMLETIHSQAPVLGQQALLELLEQQVPQVTHLLH